MIAGYDRSTHLRPPKSNIRLRSVAGGVAILASLVSAAPSFMVFAQTPETQSKTEAGKSDANAKNGDAASQTPEQKQLAEDSGKLLDLANELKTELDKSTKDTLSLSVIRKAEEVEKLARKVKEEMKKNLMN